MLLKSNLFAGDARLEACAASHPAHVMPGATGPHVRKIQEAIITLDGAVIDQAELDASHYGPSTASAVLAYKSKRDIVNPSYQSQADNIVGIMTIKALDAELVAHQTEVIPQMKNRCPHTYGWRLQADRARLAEALLNEAQRTRQPEVAAAIRAADNEAMG
jgi:peptidoglycan hydrolase-like protein with peptidoglycan-binding domain